MSRLIDISNEIKALIGLKEYKIINFMLGKAINKLPTMSTEKILTYVSATHPIRDHLDIWAKYMENVKSQFKSRNLDYTQLQIYLIQETEKAK